MFLLYTDFGWQGPYVGQMKALLASRCQNRPIIDLMHDVPTFRPREAGYLLGALAQWIRPGTVVLAVVDPGVGTERRALAAAVDESWFIGPDNGVLAPVINAARGAKRVIALPTPPQASASFHGRDVFAPAAAELALHGCIADPEEITDWVGREATADLDQIIYIDGFGNAMTGRRADTLTSGMAPVLEGQPVQHARTFGESPPDKPFWYRNSIGLVEIAVNQGNAARQFGFAVGDALRFQ